MVATVVNLTSASSTVHYFRREGHGLGPNRPANQNEAGEDYYARRDDEHRKASRWRGSGAAALGLKGHVEPGEFRRVLQGCVPGTDIRLGRLRDGEHEHRPGLDITLSAPKSVSLEALLGGPGAARAMRAHDAAVRATLDFIEARLLRTRRWSREERRSAQVNAPMLVAATFRHITSRNNDPQLHTHCVIANMTRDGGQWRSAEIGLLRRSEKLIGAYYRNELAHGLRKAGFALRPSMIGRVPGFEISGWPRAALEAFSSRRRQILDYIREKGWRYDARTAQAATLATRARKNEPRRAELEALWRDFAEERGLAKRTLRKIGLRHAEPPMALEIAWRALEQLEERASVFPAREALALALAHTPGLYRLEEIEGAFADLRRDKHLLPAIRRGVGEAWTTARAVRAEREVLARMKAGIGAVKPLAAHAVPEKALAGLTGGQREAVRSILESPDRVVGVQGHAGSGKTAMLACVASLVGERRVLGLAPSASAARTLSRETGLPCRTLQWFLTRCKEVADGVADREMLATLMDRYGGAVVAVDEMSLVGTAQARALLRIAERLDIARLVLVGDKRQLRGVEAGQPFRQLQQAGMAVAEMDELRRQRDPDLKAAIEEMIGGEPGAALERLGSNLLEIPAEEIAGMAAGLWLRLSPEARAATALLVPTRALRAEVEEAVREGLEAEGALRGHAMAIDTLVPLNLTRVETGDARNWREGDIALFNRDMKHYRVAKDDACIVMEVEEDRVRLAHGDGRPRHLKPDSELRYRLDLFEEKTLWIREGERLRWTRNDRERGLANGERAEVLETGTKALRLRLADGREMTFARNDPQLRHLAYAYASTVHAAQGQTHERVIAVLDTGAGPLVNRQTLYVQLSRARERAVVLTDNREQLLETLEANTGERLTALEAIG
ncbi:MAG: relaxase domain-containing protein, partial [Chromatiales bacterium]|nr:relaxase domain-containing protein [Chromatiales bacterium]